MFKSLFSRDRDKIHSEKSLADVLKKKEEEKKKEKVKAWKSALKTKKKAA